MGGAVSSGENNDALVDNLVDADYIRNPEVERVFRAVDRAFYFTEEHRHSAYKDLAWKHGNLHLSAPCIYSQVVENLELRPGLSFLNLGSGTGYLSTMAGLILGAAGTNHGVEFHAEVVAYAEEKLAAFMKSSNSLDEYDFCPPQFVQGNCLSLSKSNPKYDRVYCGAACPEHYENYMKPLLKIGGILVMPMNDQLLQIRRLGEESWDTRAVLPVSFASLISPRPDAYEDVILPTVNPLKLQEFCRSKIRSILKNTIDLEEPELWKRCRKTPKQKSSVGMRPCVLPIFEDSDSDHLTFEGHITSSSESDEEDPGLDMPDERELPESNNISLEAEAQPQSNTTANEDAAVGSSEDSRAEEDSPPSNGEGARTSPPGRIRYFTRSLRGDRGRAALVIIESRSSRSARGSKRRSVFREEENAAEPDMSLVSNEKNYTYFMRRKIDALPVPYPLKSFLDYSRGFNSLGLGDALREN